MVRPLILSIYGALSTALVLGAVVWALASGETETNDASSSFATALVERDASLAPAGGGDDIERLHAYYGGVRDARRLNSHSYGIASGDTRFVAELLLQTGRGPAVIQVELEGAQPDGAAVTGVRELAPAEVQEYALRDEETAALEKAFAARGGVAFRDSNPVRVRA